jgi:hypothetical protein
MRNGTPVKDAKAWQLRRRPELVQLFAENQFGKSPGKPKGMSFQVFDKGTPALDGKALRRQVTVYFSADLGGPRMDLLVYLPAQSKKPVPLLLNLSFTANSTTVNDPGVRPGYVWNREKTRVPAASVQGPIGRLDPRPFLDRGIGVATFYYGDVDPDFEGGIGRGVRRLYAKGLEEERASDEWGSIGAWAWAVSRAIDYLETDKGVDDKRIGLIGVSRLGKTALWAGAQDPRIALVIASASGEGGASLSRRNYGENVKHLCVRYGYWFCRYYQNFADDVSRMPVDSHLLIALIAPRPLLLQTGDADFWADPKGEFLAAVAASPVYWLLGKKGLDAEEMPKAGEAILSPVGYVMHKGGHGPLPEDWPVFLQFFEKHLGAGKS